MFSVIALVASPTIDAATMRSRRECRRFTSSRTLPISSCATVGIGAASGAECPADSHSTIRADHLAQHSAAAQKLADQLVERVINVIGHVDTELPAATFSLSFIKVIEGKELSPILAVISPRWADIADGFHRVSLVYRVDPCGDVPLKLADIGN